ACDWLDARVDQIDANLIKPSARWDELLAAHQNLDADADLNAPAYTPSRYALFWDEGAARVQLHCGSRPIAADPLLRSTTEYAVVYDLDADAIERVLVDELTLAL
ncbi:MAG: hypothetical protein KC468_15475, partial [Myxococcales bacterium]|nr:hypothetical protein [Myxococcales bacterium]